MAPIFAAISSKTAASSEPRRLPSANVTSSRSAIQNSLRAQPQIDRIPVQTVDMTHPARAGLGEPGGVGAPFVSSTAFPSGASVSILARTTSSRFRVTNQPERSLPPDTCRGFTNQGAEPRDKLVMPPFSSEDVRCAGMRTFGGAFPKLDPLEHLLSQTRFGLGWRARDQRSSLHRGTTTIQAIPPHKPGFFGPRTILETRLACPRTKRSRVSPAVPHPSSNGCPFSKGSCDEPKADLRAC